MDSFFFTLFGLSWFLSGSGEETKAKIDEIRTEIENLHYEKLPYVGLEHDLKLATADLDKLASDERAKNRLWKTVLAPMNIAINWKPKSEEVINSTLIRQFARLTKLCSDKTLRFPEVGTRVPLLLSANHLRRGRMILALA